MTTTILPKVFYVISIYCRFPDLCGVNSVRLLSGRRDRKWQKNLFAAITVAGTVPDLHGFPYHK